MLSPWRASRAQQFRNNLGDVSRACDPGNRTLPGPLPPKKIVDQPVEMSDLSFKASKDIAIFCVRTGSRQCHADLTLHDREWCAQLMRSMGRELTLSRQSLLQRSQRSPGYEIGSARGQDQPDHINAEESQPGVGKVGLENSSSSAAALTRWQLQVAVDS